MTDERGIQHYRTPTGNDRWRWPRVELDDNPSTGRQRREAGRKRLSNAEALVAALFVVTGGLLGWLALDVVFGYGWWM